MADDHFVEWNFAQAFSAERKISMLRFITGNKASL